MNALVKEILQRFPEVRERIFEGDEELPHLVMGFIVDWLAALRPGDISPDLTRRIKEFTVWCESQPRGGTADDDVYTILVVSFYEKLFRFEATRLLLPKLMSKKDFDQNAEYLKSWVGAENYSKAAVHYD